MFLFMWGPSFGPWRWSWSWWSWSSGFSCLIGSSELFGSSWLAIFDRILDNAFWNSCTSASDACISSSLLSSGLSHLLGLRLSLFNCLSFSSSDSLWESRPWPKLLNWFCCPWNRSFAPKGLFGVPGPWFLSPWGPKFWFLPPKPPGDSFCFDWKLGWGCALKGLCREWGGVFCCGRWAEKFGEGLFPGTWLRFLFCWLSGIMTCPGLLPWGALFGSIPPTWPWLGGLFASGHLFWLCHAWTGEARAFGNSINSCLIVMGTGDGLKPPTKAVFAP